MLDEIGATARHRVGSANVCPASIRKMVLHIVRSRTAAGCWLLEHAEWQMRPSKRGHTGQTDSETHQTGERDVVLHLPGSAVAVLIVVRGWAPTDCRARGHGL